MCRLVGLGDGDEAAGERRGLQDVGLVGEIQSDGGWGRWEALEAAPVAPGIELRPVVSVGPQGGLRPAPGSVGTGLLGEVGQLDGPVVGGDNS